MDSYSRIGGTADTKTPKVPDAEELQRNAILESMLANISSYEKKFPKVKVDVLKDDVLEKVLIAPKPENEEKFDPEVQLRGFLRAFEDLPAYAEQFNILDPRTKQQISTFKDNEKNWKDTDIWKSTRKEGFLLPAIDPGVSHALVSSPSVSPPSRWFDPKRCLLNAFVCIAKPLALCIARLKLDWAMEKLKVAQWTIYAGGPKIYEDEGNTKIIAVSLIRGVRTGASAVSLFEQVYSHMPFENWGKSIKNKPRYTFVPTTVLGVKRIVKYAREKDIRVRCSGYRHSWSDSFSQKGEILISLLPIAQVNTLPDPISIVPTSTMGKTELSSIDLIDEAPRIPKNKSWCRIGVAVTNEDFRRWAIDNSKWALPVDVILVELVCIPSPQTYPY